MRAKRWSEPAGDRSWRCRRPPPRSRAATWPPTGKAAVDQLVKVAANELGEYGIRVNSVRPGFTETPTTARSLENKPMMAEFLAGQSIARHGQVPDIAQAIRYMAGPESSWTTGQLLTVDGGHTLRAFPDYREFLDLPDQGAAAPATKA
jgi:hypothetical protein